MEQIERRGSNERTGHREVKNQKGFDFIRRPIGEEAFVHYNEIEESGFKSLNVGQIVEFIVTKKPNGLQAENMTRLPAQARLKESASR